ncbi:uncharacterized protein LOC130663475 [Microplitis mediator]|uniref:uncharacterized protein LOC130663475 n=1 Tax=Microplitis mediator TaxID=375433 RepID=UPI0025546E83|nr:uncharacterized protein LOC130663475 [Microplitis mediator]
MDYNKLNFYTEKYNKDNRNIKIVETFVPVIKEKPITGKFYSKYDSGVGKVEEKFIKLIERRTEMVPKDIYPYKPPTANMEYGWFSEPLVPRSKDPRLYFPLKQSDVVKTEMRIRQVDNNFRKSTGATFKTR